MDLKQHIRHVPDFPKPGILFYDISTLLAHAGAWHEALNRLTETLAPYKPDLLVGIESRGFLVAAPLADRLGTGFIMIRKRGKLPGATMGQNYTLEYGVDTIEIHADVLNGAHKVLLIDDLIATGGTALAAVGLLRRTGAVVEHAGFVIDLFDLGGADKLRALGVAIESLVPFPGH